jgi:flavodoxin I
VKKIAVVYWSGTGNTEAMAKAVADGVKKENSEAEIIEVESFDVATIDNYDAIAFGCPAMGDEELEETVFEPMFSEVKTKLGNKPIALFGSYSWADGEWMELWEDDCRDAGLNLATESVIAFDMPDEDAVSECEALGAALAIK